MKNLMKKLQFTVMHIAKAAPPPVFFDKMVSSIHIFSTSLVMGPLYNLLQWGVCGVCCTQIKL